MKRIILTIISLLMMATGPFLMFIPGPQLISWAGLALFICANKSWLKKFRWFRKLEHKTQMWKIDRKYRKQEKNIRKSFKKL